VGPEDANVLISNLSDESGLLASLGPVIGIAQVADTINPAYQVVPAVCPA